MSTQNVASEASKKAILNRLSWSDATITEMLPTLSLKRTYVNKCIQVLHEEKKIHISAWTSVPAKDGKNMWVIVWGFGEGVDADKPIPKYPKRKEQVGETRIRPEEGRWRIKEIAPGITRYSPTNNFKPEHPSVRREKLSGFKSPLEFL